MRKCQRTATVAILSCFIPVASGGLTAVHAATPDEPAVAENERTRVTGVVPVQPLSRYLEAAHARRVMVLPAQTVRETRARSQEQSGGGGLSTAAKTGIWLAAVAGATVWAWKTFSVTRGTD